MLSKVLVALALAASTVLAGNVFMPPLSKEVMADLAKRDPSEYQLFEVRDASMDDEDQEDGLIKRGPPSGLTGVQYKCKTKSCFAFTFDDGPYVNMRNITDTALANNFKVTFFLNVFNYACAYDPFESDQILYAYKHGMQLCSHTATHPFLTNLTLPQIDVEIELVETMLHKVTGAVPSCFRPPYGDTNDTITKYLNEKHGLVVINWTDFSGDADGKSVAFSEQVYRDIHAPKHAIVLNHEPYNTTAHEVFPAAIKIAKKNGYKTNNFQTVSKSLKFNGYKSITKPGKRDKTWNCEASIAARCATNPDPDICDGHKPKPKSQRKKT